MNSPASIPQLCVRQFAAGDVGGEFRPGCPHRNLPSKGSGLRFAIAMTTRPNPDPSSNAPTRTVMAGAVRRLMMSLIVVLSSLARTTVKAQTPSVLDMSTTQVATGVYHTCALTTAGGVECWGSNAEGQLGNGTSTDSHTPVAVTGLASGVAAIAAGGYHTCALTTTGAVECWGYNIYGQLGNGTSSSTSVPVVVTGLSSGVAAIAAGATHTCALTTTGGVQCWGSNSNGQLGNGTTADSSTPVAVSGLTSGVTAIAAGGYHTCALNTAGGVQCWGYNIYGQLGNGTTTDSSTPVAVSGLNIGVAAIGAGGSHTCALTTAGGVHCWGQGGFGQLGNGTTTDSDIPVAASGLNSGVAAIATGDAHTCALTTLGRVQCWGYNGNGQLGNGATTNSATPVNVLDSAFLPLQGVAAIATGLNTCALTTVGGVQCWGSNSNGQLGNGTTTDRYTPVAVASLSSGVAEIATGAFHTCALTLGSGVQCWGYNLYGEIGNGTTADSDTPVAVTVLASGVAAMTAGDYHTCALTTAGGVQCWGSGDLGQLGSDGTTVNSTTPVVVTVLTSGVTAIAAGAYHTCALTTAGGVQCWGYNAYGQLGNGTTSSTPVGVIGLSSGVAAIAAGGYNSCALTTAGGVQCWGDNTNGQLGNGTTTDSDTPVAVMGLTSGVAAIAVGHGHTCALTTVGGVQCWGYNAYGQLGNGTTTGSPTPVAVTGLSSGVAAIAAGVYHTCALMTAGGVQCWGANNNGQLGNGTAANSTTPVDAADLSSGVAAIAAGAYHTCALTTAGGVQCWGSNNNGQLGNGMTTDEHVPVTILAGQAIAFVPSQRMGVGNSVSLTATASGGGAVSFDTWTPSTCTFSGGKLVLTNTGWCGVRASQAGGSDGAGGTIAAAPQQLRLIRVEADLIFASGFEASGG